MKKLLINQPGRNGDILICLPIAKWYSDFYDVIEWLCPKEYHINFRNINYCTPVYQTTIKYDKVIDMSFGLNVNTTLHKWWNGTREQWQSFIIPKYIIAEVPLIKRWNLIWTRNGEREDSLYDKVIQEYGKEYAVVQDFTHDFHMNIKVENKVTFVPYDDYNIFDWYKVLLKAKEIHCIDSCLANFVEVIPELLEKPKYYYPTAKVPSMCDRTLLINNWRFV